MDFNAITNVKVCPQIVSDLMSGRVSLLYYAHIISIIVSLLLGFFVFSKGKKNYPAKALSFLLIVFSLWVVDNFITWISLNSVHIMFWWSLLGILDVSIYILSLVFIYSFFGEKINFVKKAFLSILLLPIIILTPTKFNLSVFNLDECYPIDNSFFNYLYVPRVIIVAWILFFILKKLIYNKNVADKKRNILLFFGMGCFLLTFALSGFIADKLEMYSLEMYGILSMVVFVGFLAYLIVKFRAFDIKLFAAQALVVGIIILIGSQFAFIQDPTNKILNGITFALSCAFGWWLIKSVKTENARKEQLQMLADQLAGSNAKLQKLDNAKSEFISIASHQLRTPPTAVKGYSSLLLEGSYGKLTPDQNYAINNIYKRNEDMIALIDNLLNSSRIEAGTMAFEFGKFKLEDLLQDIYETLIMKAKDKKLALEFVKLKTPLPEMTSDKAKLREVLTNLVDNAIKYTKEGKVTVKTELQKGFTALSYDSSNSAPIADAEKEEPEKDVVRITVSDTGIGIPKTELPFLFQKFSRGKDISRLNVSGTGLGLFLGKKVMEKVGGRVWAESDGNRKGSRFIVELPVEGELKEEK